MCDICVEYWSKQYPTGVDLEFWAHEHSYERLLPLYNRQVCSVAERLQVLGLRSILQYLVICQFISSSGQACIFDNICRSFHDSFYESSDSPLKILECWNFSSLEIVFSYSCSLFFLSPLSSLLSPLSSLLSPLLFYLQVCNGSRDEPYTNPCAPVHITTGSAVSFIQYKWKWFIP